MPDGQNYVGGTFHLAGDDQPLSRRAYGCLSRPRGRRPGTREPPGGYRCASVPHDMKPPLAGLVLAAG
jgi:hypothetical protein